MNIKKYTVPLFSFSLILLTFIFYWPSLFYDFQFDDNLAILKQFAIRQSTFSSLFFSSTRWVGEWINTLNFGIKKFDPFVFRITNLSIHLLATLLVFLFIYLLLGRRNRESFLYQFHIQIAAFNATLFALHPLQTQTISYIIQGRLEGLSAFFVLATLLAFFFATKVKKQWKQILAIIVMFISAALAYGSKEISVVTPFLVLLTDWFFIANGKWQAIKKRIPLHLIFFTFTIGIYVYLKKKFVLDILLLNTQVYNNIGNVLTESTTDAIKPIPFFISQFKVILHYIWIFIWPWSMSVEYDWKLSSGFFSPDCLVPFLALIAIGLFIIMLLKKNQTSLTAFSLLWFFICILPRSSIVPSGELLADYKTYLASVGIFLLLASVIIYALKKYNLTKWFWGILFLTALGLGIGTWQRNKVWRSDVDFWQDILKKAPFKARAHNNYAIALLKERRYQEAIPYLKQALQLQKGDYWDPYTNLSIAYSNLGQIDNAIDAVKSALRMNPRHPESFNSLGLLFQQQEKFNDAEKAFQVAIVLRPHYGKAYFNLGQTYLMQNELEKAWRSFKECCINGDYDTVIDGFAKYAALSMHLEKFDDAITGYQKILEIDPSIPEARMNLGNSYYFKGELEPALEAYLQTARENPQDFRPLSNTAQVYLKMNQPEKALELFQKARSVPDAPLELELKIARCFDAIGQHDTSVALLKKLASQREDPGTKERAEALLRI